MTHVLNYDEVLKVIEVPTSYGTEITIQDLLNDIRDFEEELTSLDMPIMCSAAGKEPLGGGVTVGLTLTLLDDWRLSFEPRAGPTWVQCSVSGGNLVADNINGAIYPTAYVTVTITASSSATLSELSAIQYSSFGGGVTINTDTGVSGTDYNIGTIENPVDNLTDALSIANERGFDTLFLQTSMTINSGSDITGFRLVGKSRTTTVITILDATTCVDVIIKECNVAGILDGGTQIENCSVGDISYVNGEIRNSGLYGTIYLNGNDEAVVSNCYTIDQDNYPIIDMGGSGQDLAMPNYSGIVEIQNLTSGTEEVGVGLLAGQVILDSTISAGSIIIAGLGLLVDNSTGTASVNSNGLMNKTTVSEAVWDEDLGTHITTGSTGKVLSLTEFEGHVHIDTVNGTSGTTFPQGTPGYPVDNLADALTVATANSITYLHITGSLTLTSGTDLAGYTFLADRSVGNSVTVTSIINTGVVYFQDLTVSGALTGATRFTTCVIGTVTGFDGGAKNCLFTGNVTITGTGANYFTDCDTYITSTTPKEISVGANLLNIIRCRGMYKITNYTGSSVLALDFSAGECEIDSTCTSGTIVVSGICELTDNSGVGCIVADGTLTRQGITDDVWDELTASHTDAGTTGKALTDAGAAGNPWSTTVSGNTGAGTFGELVGKKLLKFSQWFGLK